MRKSIISRLASIPARVEGVLENLNYNEYTLYKGKKLGRVIERTVNEKISDLLATDIFYTMYLALPRVKKQVPPDLVINKNIIEKIMSNPEYQKIHAETMYDEVSSVVFGVEFYRKLIEELKKRKRKYENSSSKNDRKIAEALQYVIDFLRGKHQQQMQQNQNQQSTKQSQQQQQCDKCQGISMSSISGGQGSQQGQQSQQGQGVGSQLDNMPEQLKRRLDEIMKNAVKKAMDHAKDKVDNARSLIQGFLAGKRPGTLDFSEEDLETVVSLAQQMQVKQILKLFRGIMGMMPKFTKKTKKEVVVGKYAGITTRIDDMSKILPSELALPDEIFYEKWARKALLSYRTVAVTEKGGLYVLIDKSGSMGGKKIIWAKAVALALLSKAVREGRPFYLRFFDYAVYNKIYVDPKKARKHGFKNVMEVLRKIAMVIANGGTNIEGAILTAVNDIINDRLHEKGISDIVIITDGEDEVNYENVSKALREAKTRIMSIMIEGDNPTLRKISWKYMYAKLDEVGALKIVEALD